MKRKYVFGDGFDKLTVYDVMRMTHLNVSFGLIKNNLVTVDHLKHLDRIPIYKKINPDLKVILSIGGWAADGFSQAADTQETRAIFTKSAMDIVYQWDFDGIDIDWEYPCSPQAGIAYGPQDKKNFTYLMQDLRKALDAGETKTGREYILSCAVGASQSFIDSTEMDEVAKVCTFVNLMTYDMRGGFQRLTGHHTNLYSQTGDENGPSGALTVKLFNDAGVPLEKMVYGAAFYGRVWKDVFSTDQNGLNQASPGVGSGGGDYDQIAALIGKDGFVRYWDDQAKAAYLFNGTTFISYDDANSLKEKCKFIKEKGLAGLMYWAYGSHTLFNVVDENLK